MYPSIQSLDRNFWTTNLIGQYVQFDLADMQHRINRIVPCKKGAIIHGVGLNKGFAVEVNSSNKIVDLFSNREA